jgi:hypothetical protein
VGFELHRIIRGDEMVSFLREFRNGKMRDELLELEIFANLRKAKALIDQWRSEENQLRPQIGKIGQSLTDFITGKPY